MESSALLCVRHRMKRPLHFPKCSCTQPSCEMQKTITRTHVFLYVHAGDLASTMASLHVRSRGNHLPICRTGGMTMGPLCITNPPEAPCFPCEQLCRHTSSASKICWGVQGTCREASRRAFAHQRLSLQCLSALQLGHPVLHPRFVTGKRHSA